MLQIKFDTKLKFYFVIMCKQNGKNKVPSLHFFPNPLSIFFCVPFVDVSFYLFVLSSIKGSQNLEYLSIKNNITC